MKKTHIAAIIFLVIGLAAIITTVYDADTYSSFEEARKNPGRQYHIIGSLVADKPAEETIEDNTLIFSFHMLDDKGTESKVIHFGPRPQDFEKLDQVVIVGQYSGEAFLATEMLLKCPSKYEKEFEDQQQAQTASQIIN